MISEEKYRMFLVENIKVASQMLYEMADGEYNIVIKSEE